MKKKIFCVKLKKKLEGLEFVPIKGDLGENIKKNVSLQAWKEWLRHQVILINENKLNLTSSKDKTFLKNEMSKYFFGEK